MENSYHRVLNSLTDICKNLYKYSDLIDNDILIEVQNLEGQFKNNIENILEENRVLKIGIVGEVKAGKSSFLNAMIFEGEEILPKAPTPMTAALTKITYSEKFSAKIVYYDKDDWNIIEKRAEKYQEEAKRIKNEYFNNMFNQNRYRVDKKQQFNLTDEDEKEIKRLVDENVSKELKACYELIEMLEERNLSAYEYLGEEVKIENVYKIEDFIGVLNEYVGANGKFTPLVKYSEISLNLPILKGIEIIDTPGTNDPIISRGMVTKRFLGQCDVVFLLSYAGQFLSSEDMKFLVSMLPVEGISNAVLIGSKFDSAVLDNNKSDRSLMKASMLSVKNITEHAQYTISNSLKGSEDNKVLNKIKDSLPPEFVSSIFYMIGKKNCVNLNQQEEFVVETFRKRFDDFIFSPEFMKEFSNIERVKKNKFDEVRKEKDSIIQERVDRIILTKLTYFLKLLEKINIDINDKYNNILNFEKSQLEEKYNKLETELQGVRFNVNYIFEKNIVRLKKEIQRLKLDIEKKQLNYSEIDINKREESYEYTVKTGFLKLKKETRTRYETINYVNTNQVVQNIQKYILDLKENIIDQFDRIIDIESLKQELKKAIISVFDLSDSNFRESEILGPVELVLEKITVPKLMIPKQKYENMIVKEFSIGEVEGNEIHNLVYTQNKVLDLIANDLINEIDILSEEICRRLQIESTEFVDNIIQKVLNNVEQLKHQIDEKEEYTRKYQELITSIKKYKTLTKNLME